MIDHKKKLHSTRRSVATYLLILFICAVFLLLLAHFTQDRGFARLAAELAARGAALG